MYVVQLGKTEVIIRDADLRIGETIVRHKGSDGLGMERQTNSENGYNFPSEQHGTC